MAIKDLIAELETKLETIQIDSVAKGQITNLVEQAKSEAEKILADLKRTTDETVGRKNKIGQLSNTIIDLQNQNRQIDVLKQQNEKLSKYRQSAINQKKNQVAKIKNLFDMKLENQTSKDYQKYKNISSQFNFDDTTEQGLTKNIQVFKILEVAGTFDNDKSMIRQPMVPKSDSNKDKTNTNKSFL